ncbi:hypothetical protein KI387_044118 [Taxus chinensis]|uniref:Uncharacterized protein n=1 Tax=Taxus chinensis TaxID=29808 RepID=A0AA38CGJ1_TAXCH|nr:hypothetical protein KI387_044118 [Taxus chinensis]
MIDFCGGGAPKIDFEEDEDVTSVVVFRDREGCLIKTNDNLDHVDLDEGGAPKIGLIRETEGTLDFGDEDDGPDKRGDASLVCEFTLQGTSEEGVVEEEDDGSDGTESVSADAISLDFPLIGKIVSVMEEVDDEGVVPCEGGASGTVILGVTNVGKETGRVKIKYTSIEVGTTIGMFTNGIVRAKMGEIELDVFTVETRRDVIASSIERISDDETDEDDTVSGIDGRSDKEEEGNESVSNKVGIFKDEVFEDDGIPTISGAIGGSNSVDVFVDGLVLEEYSSVEMKLIV